MKLARLGTAAAVVGAAVAFAGIGVPTGAHGAATAVPRAITVSGTGTVITVPDRAQFTFGVSTDAKTATAALNGNASEMVKVINALKAAGVAGTDIQTQSVSLSPKYNQSGDEVVGYTATNAVTVTVKDLDKSGLYIDTAVGAGANQVSGPNLIRSDQSALYQRALRGAIADAVGKAKTIAGASRIRLGRVLNVVEGSAPTPVPFGVAAPAESPKQTPIEAGTTTVQATVTVTFAVA
jgi:uncharacterized protein YggE